MERRHFLACKTKGRCSEFAVFTLTNGRAVVRTCRKPLPFERFVQAFERFVLIPNLQNTLFLVRARKPGVVWPLH